MRSRTQGPKFVRLVLIAAVLGSGLALLFGSLALASGEAESADETQAERSATAEHHEIPDLPFGDNPDPEACGIPQRWGSDDPAWLDGTWEGELIEPNVHLYDSHLRREVMGRAPSGTQVRVILFQDNPVLNYYMVEVAQPDGSRLQGWVPAPFLSFEEPG